MSEDTTTDAAIPENASEGTTPEQEVFPKEYVVKLREESAKYRTQLREREAEAEAARQETLKRAPLEEQLKTLTTELETTKAAAAESAKRARQANLKAQLAGKVLDADAAMRLLDDDFVTEDDGVRLDAFLEKYAFLRPNARPTVPSANAAGTREGDALYPDDFEGKSEAWREANIHRLRART